MNIIKVREQNQLVQADSFPYAKFPFTHFNPVQSRVIEHCTEDVNYIVASHTATGKTRCAELFMSHEVRKKGGKAIYLSPLKALSQEKIDDWTDKTHHFSDLRLSICTGDYRLTPSRKKELDESNVIIMTNEMLNSKLRNFTSEKNDFLKQVGTMVVDEGHLLTVPGRGNHAECSIMKFTYVNPQTRLILLSATMPNVSEIGEWLYKLNGKKTVVLESDYRPVPLNIHYHRYWDVPFGYDENEKSKVAEALHLFEKYPTDKFLMFVHTKRTGEMLYSALKERGAKCEYHYSDLDKEKRVDIENRFRNDPKLRCLVATSGMAWGCYKHGSRVVGSNGLLRYIQDIEVGESLMCPVKNGFLNKKVVKIKDYELNEGYFVKLESGEEMVVSPDHIFWAAIKRQAPDWVNVNEISKGDFLAIPRLELWNSKPDFDRFWYLVGFGFGDGSISKSGNYADGSIKATLDFCLGHRDEHAEIFCQLFNNDFSSSYHPRDHNNIPHLVTKKREIVDKFRLFLPLGRKNGTDDLPKEIFDNPSRIANFLRGWYDADGGMEDHSNGNFSIGLSCISKKAIETAKHFLSCFGIRSSMGRKRMKDTIINGRFQKAVRKWSYRVRIFGFENVSKFRDRIGFIHPEKKKILDEYISKIDNNKLCKDPIPARELIKKHLDCNNLKGSDFTRITNCKLWGKINKQECNRKTLMKLLYATKHRSDLNDLMDSPVWWSRIKEISKCEGGKFREIEVEDPHAYIGCGVISHNCNTPARRVVILGVHRGITEVENYDIWQQAGRAGRPQYDPCGDVYILLPKRNFDKFKAKLETPQLIKSQMLDTKCLAFHLTSEIHHREIQSSSDVFDWYERSLAHHQNNSLHEGVVNEVVESLKRCGAVKVEENAYDITPIGILSSMFYFSPFDISDLNRNFNKLFDYDKEKNDFWLAMALANTETHRLNIASNADRDEMSKFKFGMQNSGCERAFLGNKNFMDGCIKIGCCYYHLLRGQPNVAFSALMRGLKMDAERLCEVLGAIDQMAGKWGRKDYFGRLHLRLMYGVEEQLVELCMIDGIGAVKAKRLWDANLKSLEEVSNNVVGVIKALHCSQKVATEVCHSAKKLLLTNS